MAVRVTKDGPTIKFYPESSSDSDLAHYLSGLVNGAKRLGESADADTVAKAGLSGVALIRKEAETKLALLKQQIEVWDERSRDWGLSKEIRDLNKSRADSAREEARKLAQELGE